MSEIGAHQFANSTVYFAGGAGDAAVFAKDHSLKNVAPDGDRHVADEYGVKQCPSAFLVSSSGTTKIGNGQSVSEAEYNVVRRFLDAN